MTLAQRLRSLRVELGLTQAAFAASGFVSAPGWVKIENGQRQPSEKLLDQLVLWLVRERHLLARDAAPLRAELFTLRYLGSPSAFVRALAQTHARDNQMAHLLHVLPVAKPKRGRPAAISAEGRQ